jgi:hypothetical protein
LLLACDAEPPAPRAAQVGDDFLAAPVVRVARGDGGPALVVATPAPAALDEFARALAADPARSGDPLAYHALPPLRARWLDDDGGWRPAELRGLTLRGEDPVLGDSFVVDLLAADGRVFAHPLAGVAAPTPSPADPHLLLLEREFALYLVDAAAEVVTPLGDARARAAALASVAEVSLVDEGPSMVWATAPQWSPDGTQVAFLSTRGGEPTLPDLWVHALDGGDERRVASPGAPVRLLGWHGDDLLVEDHGDRARPRVARVDLDRGHLHALADGVAIGRGGDLVAVASGPPGQLRVDLLDLASGAVRTLVALRPGELLRAWRAELSDDGARVALDLTDDRGAQTLLLAGADGRLERRPLPGPGQLAGDLAWVGERLLVPLEDLSARTATTHLVTAP